MDPRITTMPYADGALCVLFKGEHGPQKLSTNVEGWGKRLKPGHFLVKNWSENVRLAQLALESGLFEDTGASIPSGHVQVPIWKIKGFTG